MWIQMLDQDEAQSGTRGQGLQEHRQSLESSSRGTHADNRGSCASGLGDSPFGRNLLFGHRCRAACCQDTTEEAAGAIPPDSSQIDNRSAMAYDSLD